MQVKYFMRWQTADAICFFASKYISPIRCTKIKPAKILNEETIKLKRHAKRKQKKIKTIFRKTSEKHEVS